jgi:hypothetical protein
LSSSRADLRHLLPFFFSGFYGTQAEEYVQEFEQGMQAGVFVSWSFAMKRSKAQVETLHESQGF